MRTTFFCSLSVKHRQPSGKKLQDAVYEVENWSLKTGFNLSAEKSKLIHICKRRKHRELRSIKIRGQPLEVVKSARVLGVVLDHRMTFKQHAGELRERMASIKRLFAVIGGRWSSGPRSTLLKIHRSLTIPKLTHGAGLVSRGGKKVLQILEPEYNAIIRCISGAFRTSPIESMMAECGELPFHYIWYQALVLKTIQWLAQQENQIEAPLVSRADEQFLELTGLHIPPIAKKHRTGSRPWSMPKIHIDWTLKARFKAGEQPEIGKALFSEIASERYRDRTKIYTDGSVVEDQVGFGISTDNEEIHGRLPDGCSIFSAEAHAIMVALQWTQGPNSSVIFSDSASCLAAIENGNSNHPWIQHAEQLARSKNATLCWVPAHVGILGNEKADRLAATGRNDPVPNIPIPVSDAKKLVKRYIRWSWESKWRNTNQSFLRRVKNTTISWQDRKSNKERRAITRLRIGHTNISHRTIFTRENNICSTCGVETTVSHILADCRKYDTERSEANLDSDITNILNNNESNEDRLVHFLKKM